MHCHAFGHVQEYDIEALIPELENEFDVELYGDVLHVSTRGEDQHVFIFAYGVLILWNIPEKLHDAYLSLTQAYGHGTVDCPEDDVFSFRYGERSRVWRDEIILPDQKPLTKLAISHALAQSIKLGIFEQRIQKIINETEHLPQQLAKHGKIPLKAKDIRRQMAQLYIERSTINLHYDLLDEPEFLWDYDELVPIYTMAAKHLDIDCRVEVLTKRQEVVHELFDMLGTEVHNQHFSRLELTIVLLICLEVVITLTTIGLGIH